MKTIVFALLALLAISSLAARRSKEEWKSRTIYQVLTDRFATRDGRTDACKDLWNYCGGDYVGLKNNLDYIQGMGFDAIWVSPIVKNTPGGYHGYWAADLYSLNEEFGTEQEFRDLISEMHKRDMWIMVDVVANHMGPVGEDYGRLDIFKNKEDYHDYCIINQEDFHGDQWRVENCRLADLPDLNTESEYVQNELYDWIDWMVTEYDIDGLRIDTIPEVPQWFWKEFQQRAGCYAVGEVFDGRVDYIAEYQDPNKGGVDGLLNYPMSIAMKGIWAYKNANMYAIRDTLNYERTKFHDTHALAQFVDNHDNKRFLNIVPDHKAFQAALVFSIFAEGIPMVYYGSEQNYGGGDDPKNREQLWTDMKTTTDTYQILKQAISARKTFKTWNTEHVERYITENFYAFTRGEVLVAVTNSYNDQAYEISYHDFAEGTVLCNVLADGDCVSVSGGVIPVYLRNAETKVFTPVSRTAEQATE